MKNIIRIGTRKSKLAMKQTDIVIELIKKANPEAAIEFEVVPMTTIGDEILNKPLIEFGGKGAFVSEIEKALQNGVIDLAVHSAKDMPMELAQGLAIIGVPRREDPRDVLISLKTRALSQHQKQEQYSIGTSSLRRQMQIGRLYPATCNHLRGNVNTRLEKLKNGEYDGIILAAAGIKRLDLDHDVDLTYQYFSCEDVIPAAGQGILAVEGRIGAASYEMVSKINHPETVICLELERMVLRLLGAGCNEPVGVYSYIENQMIYLTIMYGYQEESHLKQVTGNAAVSDYKKLAQELVGKLGIDNKSRL